MKNISSIILLLLILIYTGCSKEKIINIYKDMNENIEDKVLTNNHSIT